MSQHLTQAFFGDEPNEAQEVAGYFFAECMLNIKTMCALAGVQWADKDKERLALIEQTTPSRQYGLDDTTLTKKTKRQR